MASYYLPVMPQQQQQQQVAPQTPPAAATEIIPGLFLGGKHDVDCSRWTHILNLWRKELPAHQVMAARTGASRYLHVPFADLPEEEFRMMTELRRVLLFLDAAMACPDARVLVHCRKGISRSATVCAAFLLHTGRIPLAHGGGYGGAAEVASPVEAALNFLRERRPQVQPNVGFIRFLEWYQQNVAAVKESLMGGGGESYATAMAIAAQQQLLQQQQQRLCLVPLYAMPPPGLHHAPAAPPAAAAAAAAAAAVKHGPLPPAGGAGGLTSARRSWGAM
jgi:atypical dual specificity phosphatase